jgi:hypothetical protein
MESESSFEQGDLFWLALQDIHPSDWERKGQMGNSQEAPFIPTQDIEGTSCREDVLRCPEEGLGCDRPGRFEAPDFEAGGSRASHGERKPCRPVDASLASTRLGQMGRCNAAGSSRARQRNRRTRRGRDAPWKELKGEKERTAGNLARRCRCMLPFLPIADSRSVPFPNSSQPLPAQGPLLFLLWWGPTCSSCTDRISAHMPSAKLRLQLVLIRLSGDNRQL